MGEEVWDFLDIYKWRYRPSLFCKQVLGFTPSSDQEKFLDDMTDLSIDRALIMSPRGAGMTISVSSLAAWTVSVLADFLGRKMEVCILAGSSEQANEAYKFCKEFFSAHPYLSSKLKDEPTKTITLLRNGGFIQRLTCSSKAIMGKHVDLLVLDEPCDVPNELILEAFPIVETSLYPRIVMCGVPKKYLHVFVDIWKNPELWEFKIYNWSLENCHWRRDIHGVMERAKQTVDEMTYTIHYLGRPFPAIGTVFDQRALADCRVREEYHRQGERPVICGIDWGHRHPTAIVIIQEQEEGIAVLYAREFPQAELEKVHREIERLASEYYISIIYADRSWIGENQRLKTNPSFSGIHIREIPFKGRKDIMIGRLRKLIKERQLMIPLSFQRLTEELANYTYETKSGDDLVDALMLATLALGTTQARGKIYAVSRSLRRLLPSSPIVSRKGIYTKETGEEKKEKRKKRRLIRVV